MYRPLVQPKFHNSRGQVISPGLSVLATGGPKHRGKLVVSNPDLFNGAEGWDEGAGFCPSLVREDGRVIVTNLTNADCNLLTQTVQSGIQAGHRYQVFVHVSEGDFTNGYIRVLFGGFLTFGTINQPGYYIRYIDMPGPLNDRAELDVLNATADRVVVNFFGVYDVGVY